MLNFLLLSISIFILAAFVKFIHKVWWVPIQIQSIMLLQGIRGPSYKILHGNIKLIMEMKEKTFTRSNVISHDIFPRIMPHMHAWFQVYGKIHLIWHGPQAQLVVKEPELAKEILGNKNGAYSKIKPEGHIKKLLGDGILVCEGEKWLKLRKIANHAFRVQNLMEMVPAMIASVETMIERWSIHEGQEIDVYQEFRLLTSEIISRTAFGSSHLEGKNIFDSLMELQLIISRNHLAVRFPLIGKFLKTRDDIAADKIEQQIRDSITAMIKKREEDVSRGTTRSFGPDLLGSLITACHESDESNRISTDVVIDECRLFYIAGQETSNGLLAWSILLLAMNKNWQVKAREEVLDLFGKHNPNPEGIARLKIMNMILNETLRLYGPVADLRRKVIKQVKLGKFTLPANIEVCVPSKAMHHDPELWGEDAHLFKPERFADGVAKATNNITTAFIPFGFGNRICVGMNFALNEVKIALSMIMQRYEFTISPTYVHSPIQVITIFPQYGIQVMLKKL